MSAASHPTPGQTVEPAAIQTAPAPPGSRRLWWLILGGIVSAGGFLAYQLWLKRSAEATPAPVVVVRTAKVVSGTLEQTLRLGGESAAKNYASINVPRLRGPERRSPMFLIYLAKSGSMVKKGEKVAEIDSTATRDHIDDVKAIVLQSEQDIRKRKAEQALEWENLQQTLRVAKSELDKAKLEAQAAEVRTAIDQELIRLSVEEAEAQYKQLQGDLANEKITHAAELRILEITHTRNEIHINRHVEDLGKLTMYTPMDGLAVMLPMYRGGEFAPVEQGDQVGSGQVFMRIVDTRNMQLEAYVNQTDASELRLAMSADVTLDAFAGLHFRGKIQSIGALATSGWRQNYYIRTLPVRVQIEGNDPRLIPDLSGAANVVLARKENAVMVPQEAVQMEGAKTVVYVKRGARYVKQEVQTGLSTNTDIEITAGLQPGEEVALERPSSPAS